MSFLCGYYFRRNSTIWAMLLTLMGAGIRVQAEEMAWTYDFSTGSLGDDWNLNTNNPAVGFSEFLPGIAHLKSTGTSTFQSTAIHETSHAIGIGDSLRFRLGWSPFDTKDSANGNNEVFQLGVMNLKNQSWQTTTDRLTTGDSFWLSGREIASTAPTALDEWGTQSLNLWLQMDELSGSLLDTGVANSLDSSVAESMGLGLGLGNIEIESFRQGSDGSVSAKFFDIDLQLNLIGDGSFDYNVEIFSYEWTQLGGMTSWFNEGSLFESSGNLAHQMDSTESLHPAIGFLVADSSQLGVSSSKYSLAPSLVPEPTASGMVLLGLAGLGLRRGRR